MFSGSYVAIVTPFKNGKIDEEKLVKLIEFQIANKTSGIVPCGTTGESATLSNEEHSRVIELAVKTVKKRIKVVAGTGSNSTREAIELTTFAEKIGCDGVLQVSPYYNKPTQKGLFLHFKAIAQSVSIPIMLYNIMSRTGVNIEPETIASIAAECPNVIAIKEASGNIEQMKKIRELCPNMDLLSGDDALTLPVLAIGGTGVVSVVANIVPAEVADMVQLFRQGKEKEAQKIFDKLAPLVKAMFIETNPIPVKTAMGMLGMCSSEMRLPLCQMEENNKVKLEKAIREYGLLK